MARLARMGLGPIFALWIFKRMKSHSHTFVVFSYDDDDYKDSSFGCLINIIAVCVCSKEVHLGFEYDVIAFYAGTSLNPPIARNPLTSMSTHKDMIWTILKSNTIDASTSVPRALRASGEIFSCSVRGWSQLSSSCLLIQ